MRVKVRGGGASGYRQGQTTQDHRRRKPKKNGPHFSRPTLCLSLFSFAFVTTLISSSPTPIFICFLDWCFLFFSFICFKYLFSFFSIISWFLSPSFFFFLVARRQRWTFRPYVYGWNVNANGKAWCRHQAKAVP